MKLICFRTKAYLSKLPILRLCYAATTFYRLPPPTVINRKFRGDMAKKQFSVFRTGEIEVNSE